MSPHVLLGGGGATLSLGNVTAAVYYYPNPASGLFLKGGVGGSAFSGDPSADGAGTGSNGSVVITGWKQTIFEFGLDVTFH